MRLKSTPFYVLSVLLKCNIFVYSAAQDELQTWIGNVIPEIDREHSLTYSKEDSRRISDQSGTTTSTDTRATTKGAGDLNSQATQENVQDVPILRSQQKTKKGFTRPMLNLKQNDGYDKCIVWIKLIFHATSKKPMALNKYLLPNKLKESMEVLVCDYNKKGINITVDVVGKTIEYHDIVLLTMTRPEDDDSPAHRFRVEEDRFVDEAAEKKFIFVVHGLSTTHKIMWLQQIEYFKLLLDKYVSYLDKFNIFLMPMANPDGAFFGQNKNASPQGPCSGVALDRNFDIAWSYHKNVSSCSEFYPGPTPFSEPETRAVRDVLHRYNHKIVAYIHIHSSTLPGSTAYQGDAILYPKGYTETNSDDDRYIDIKSEVDELMRASNFQALSVEVQSLFERYGLVVGTSVDYAATVYGIPFSLEFAVQDFERVSLVKTHMNYVWFRIIDIVFTYIYRNTNNAEVDN